MAVESEFGNIFPEMTCDPRRDHSPAYAHVDARLRTPPALPFHRNHAKPHYVMRATCAHMVVESESSNYFPGNDL